MDFFSQKSSCLHRACQRQLSPGEMNSKPRRKRWGASFLLIPTETKPTFADPVWHSHAEHLNISLRYLV